MNHAGSARRKLSGVGVDPVSDCAHVVDQPCADEKLGAVSGSKVAGSSCLHSRRKVKRRRRTNNSCFTGGTAIDIECSNVDNLGANRCSSIAISSDDESLVDTRVFGDRSLSG